MIYSLAVCDIDDDVAENTPLARLLRGADVRTHVNRSLVTHSIADVVITIQVFVIEHECSDAITRQNHSKLWQATR